ncbi:fused MFS/spermidine synthase [Alicyclobacillus curvatus]|nr:fused MFS/spermidine synthase [Alicyclobacillus curvatus]
MAIRSRQESHRIALQPKFYYFYVLATGASVMALELAASRFLAPYFGTSMIVWANIIGLILLALSVGYFVGGRIADKHPNHNLLMYISWTAGLWTASLPIWGHLIFRSLSAGILNTPFTVIILSLVAVLLVFAPPVFLLAMVSPFTIRLTTKTSGDAGKVAGNLYAFSTIGSLIGTFGTAFFTIPTLGVVQTLLTWSLVLILVSVLGLSKRSMVAVISVLVFALLAFAGMKASGAHSPYGKVVWSKDTLYQYVQVVKEGDGSTALIYNEGGGVQSVARPNNALGPYDYYDDYLMLPFLTKDARSVAVLGSAGGTIPHLLSVYDKPDFPKLTVTGVEIDPAVIPLDYEYFGLKPGEARLVNQDARVFIRNTTQKFDIVIVDAYINQIYIPPHMSTVEFFGEIKSRLRQGGIAALNVNATTKNSPLLLSFEKTLKQVYPYVYQVRARGEFNYLLLASDSPIDVNRLSVISPRNPLFSVAQQWPLKLNPLTAKDVQKGMILTDNRAPIEMLTDSMIFNYARQEVSPTRQ